MRSEHALEDEAYRGLPRLMKERLGPEVVGWLTRREVKREEINIFDEGAFTARGKANSHAENAENAER